MHQRRDSRTSRSPQRLPDDPSYARRIRASHEQLHRMSLRWSAGCAIEPRQAQELRRAAFALNHDHYLDKIPVYREIADAAGLGPAAPFEAIVSNLLLPDAIFKSYPQADLDAGRFDRMNAWLERIFHAEVDADLSQVRTVDQWLESLGRAGVHAVYSSGTSGNLSFVPRDDYAWDAFRQVPLMYTPGLLASRGLGPRWKNALTTAAARTLSPSWFRGLSERMGFRDFDGVFLGFDGGNQGIQIVGRELADKVRSATFLYPLPISATALRTLTRGPSAGNAEQERTITEEFLRQTVQRKDDNYARIIASIHRAKRDRQKVFLFGAPYLVKELCDRAKASEGHLSLPAGSMVVYGGGWKSFDGERLLEAELFDLIEQALGVSTKYVVEAYSMTEISALMAKCAHGRFHIPPYLETVIMDAALEPVEGDDVAGILGVMDPFAVSYPGFLITGDNVHRVTNPCPCGIAGDTLLEVGRAAGAEVKGCGGIMSAVAA